MFKLQERVIRINSNVSRTTTCRELFKKWNIHCPIYVKVLSCVRADKMQDRQYTGLHPEYIVLGVPSHCDETSPK